MELPFPGFVWMSHRTSVSAIWSFGRLVLRRIITITIAAKRRLAATFRWWWWWPRWWWWWWGDRSILCWMAPGSCVSLFIWNSRRCLIKCKMHVDMSMRLRAIDHFEDATWGWGYVSVADREHITARCSGETVLVWHNVVRLTQSINRANDRTNWSTDRLSRFTGQKAILWRNQATRCGHG